MRKILRPTFGHLFNKNWVLAATLICGASVFTVCSSNDDNPAGQTDVSAISDWRLPTYDELNAMYAAIDDINEAFGTDITELCSPTTSR
jgi:hypothetical protein